MKQLMLGNAAIARGLYEAGCRLISSYPGTPSTEITEETAKYTEMYSEWAPNEKVAMETAIGASMAGARSFCAMKHVGLNVAADPLFTVAYPRTSRIPATTRKLQRSPCWSPPIPRNASSSPSSHTKFPKNLTLPS